MLSVNNQTLTIMSTAQRHFVAIFAALALRSFLLSGCFRHIISDVPFLDPITPSSP